MRIAKFLTGDTLIEVLLATTIFSFVAISSMVIINNNTNNLEANLELTMARAEIDAQAEAIRFIHDAYVAESDFSYSDSEATQFTNSTRSPYHRLWQRLTNSTSNNSAPGLLSESATPTAEMNCQNYYNDSSSSIYAKNRHAYIIDTRNLAVATRQTDSNWFTLSNLNKVIVPATTDSDNNNKFSPATTYARIIYGKDATQGDPSDNLIGDNSTDIQSAQGIWVITVPQQGISVGATPQFYDFHIYTCWYGPGREVPTTIGTILRLYNPRYKS